MLDSSEAHLSKLVVVDNASDDGTAEWLATQEDPRLVNYRLETNTGGAGGLRQACALSWLKRPGLIGFC
nr:glycosyltransferase [Sulfitobacter faviae]